MGFRNTERLKFNPRDEILEVYHSIYVGKTPFADTMECEEFLMSIEDEFGVSVSSMLSVWHEKITLGGTI